MAAEAPQEGTEEVVMRIAKTLQFSHFKQTSGGEPRKWRDVPQDEKKLWLRLARTARKLALEPAPTAGDH